MWGNLHFLQAFSIRKIYCNDINEESLNGKVPNQTEQ